MKKNKIKEIISKKNWILLLTDYSVKEVCSLLNFKEAMLLTDHLFHDAEEKDEDQQFAIQLAFEIKSHFKNEWENDWKNEVFLAHMCYTLWRYEEGYLCYKRAYDKLSDPPEALLLLLAACRNNPEPSITIEEYECFIKRAFEKKATAEAALMMRTLYKFKGDLHQENYWDSMYKKLENANAHMEAIVADVLKN